MAGATCLHAAVSRPSLRTPDQVVLELLARRVRLLSFDQLGRIVAPDALDPERAGKTWAERFERAGLVERFTVVARVPEPARMLLRYTLGDNTPNFAALARELKARAQAVPAVTMQVVRLGFQGEKLFATTQPRLPRRSEASHDLQLAEVAVHLEQQGQVVKWRSEDELLRAKAYQGVVPDAEVLLTSGESLVVECGGSYCKSKLSDFHAAVTPLLEASGGSGYCIV